MKTILLILIGLCIAGILSIKIPVSTTSQEINTTQRTHYDNKN